MRHVPEQRNIKLFFEIELLRKKTAKCDCCGWTGTRARRTRVADANVPLHLCRLIPKSDQKNAVKRVGACRQEYPSPFVA